MVNLIIGWALLAGLYVVFIRGYDTDDPVRAAAIAYRRKRSGPLGLLPPSIEPAGIALWVLTIAGFLGGIVMVFVGKYVGLANSVMIGSFLLNVWRDDKWLKAQSDYRAAIKNARTKDAADD